MAENDELGDFFAEIQEVEKNIEEYTQGYDSSGKQDDSLQKQEEKPTVSVINEVISKPAEIVSKASLQQQSYPIFTYEAIPVQPKERDSGDNNVTTVNPPSSSAAVAASTFFPRQNTKFVRKAGGDVWVDDSLQEWPENDYRIFVGDLGKEVTTEMLAKHFQIYKSFAKAKVIRSKNDNKTRGYGFVSFLDPSDCIKAIREQNGKYLGARPITVRRSDWKDRDIKEVKKQESKKRKLQESLGLV